MIAAEKLYTYRRKQRALRGKEHPPWKNLSYETKLEWEEFVKYIFKTYKKNKINEVEK